MTDLSQATPATLRDLKRAFQRNQPVGVVVDALHLVRKQLRIIRKLEQLLAKEVRAMKKQAPTRPAN